MQGDEVVGISGRAALAGPDEPTTRAFLRFMGTVGGVGMCSTFREAKPRVVCDTRTGVIGAPAGQVSAAS